MGKASWILAILLALVFLAFGAGKFTAGAEENLHDKLGVPLWALPLLGIIEFALAVTLLVPATRVYAAAFVIPFMLGALGTHLLASDWAGAPMPLVPMALAAGLLRVHKDEVAEIVAKLKGN